MAIRLDRAKKLLNCKFSLIVASDKKIPVHSWKEFQTSQISEKQIDKEIQKFEAAYLGYVTGYEDVFCVDVDLKVLHLEDRDQWFKEFISFIRDSIDSFDKKVSIHKTMNFGYHLTYRTKTDMGNEKLAVAAKSGMNQNEAVIETRGKGGYAIVYDDCYNGLDYTEIQYLTNEEHQTIIDICRGFDESYIQNPAEDYDSKVNHAKHGFSDTRLKPWQDFNEKHTVLSVVGDEFKVIRQTSKFTAIKRHGATSAHSGYIYNDSRCMYLFSTGTQYPSRTLLSPALCYAWKCHGGDLSAAGSQLYLDGYGDRVKPKEKPNLEVVKEKIEKQDFPLDVFPPIIQDYIISCNETLGHNVDFMGASVMWVASLMIGNSVKIRLKTGYTDCCSVWIAAVGSAGVGKTPAIKDAIRPLIEINKRSVRDYAKAKAEFDEYSALSEQEKKNVAEVRMPTRRQFIVDDATIEALIELHEENPNAVGVFKDELAGWIKEMNKYRVGADLEFWLKSFSNSFASTNRKTVKGNYIDSPLIPVLGGIQPAVLSKIFTEDYKDNGFTDRILLTYPDHEPPKWSYDEMDEESIQRYDDFILSLHGYIKSDLIQLDEDGDVVSNYLEMSPEAKAKLGEVMDRITDMMTSDNESESMKSILPKMKTYIPRFMILLHVLNNYDDGLDPLEPVSLQTLNNSQRLVDYFINMSKKVMQDAAEYNKLKASSHKQVKSESERFQDMYNANPNLKTKDAASVLNVTVRSIQRWKKQLDEQKEST